MATDNSIIIGNNRPMIGVTEKYAVKKPYIAIGWEIWRGNQRLEGNTTGEFTFLDASLGEDFVIHVYYFTEKLDLKNRLHATLAVKPLPWKPEFVTITWQDANLDDIGDKNIEYLDEVYLTVRTANIEKGKYLSARIIDTSTNSAGKELYAYVDEHSIARFKVSPELRKFFCEKFSFEKAIHKYRAEIKYFNKGTPYGEFTAEDRYLTVVKKSEILSVANVAGQAIPPKNGEKPVVVEDDRSDKKRKDPIIIKLNVFFDGTRNNRTNVEIREKTSRTPEENRSYKLYGKEDSSYEQGYSNVAIMQWCDAFNERQNKNEITIYIEGIGTYDFLGDMTLDLATGVGFTGLLAKVKRALDEISKKRKDVVNKDEYVAGVEVNVFGFSRGAATARHFVSTKRSEIAMKLSTSKVNVIFTFVGLFDTVSSFGIDLNFENDTKELSLDMGGKAKKVLQLKALYEYRANFSLTDITSSIQAGVGYELGLPGAHSDIGGGYRESIEEKVRYYYPSRLIDWLIKEGWYPENPKHKINLPFNNGGFCELERTVVNAYQYIPLTIMVNFAIKYGGMKFNYKLNTYYKKIPPALVSLRDRFVKEANKNDGARSTTVNKLPEEEKKWLRHNYLHLSAFREGGQYDPLDYLANKGRYNDGGMPERQSIQG